MKNPEVEFSRLASSTNINGPEKKLVKRRETPWWLVGILAAGVNIHCGAEPNPSRGQVTEERNDSLDYHVKETTDTPLTVGEENILHQSFALIPEQFRRGLKNIYITDLRDEQSNPYHAHAFYHNDGITINRLILPEFSQAARDLQEILTHELGHHQHDDRLSPDEVNTFSYLPGASTGVNLNEDFANSFQRAIFRPDEIRLDAYHTPVRVPGAQERYEWVQDHITDGKEFETPHPPSAYAQLRERLAPRVENKEIGGWVLPKNWREMLDAGITDFFEHPTDERLRPLFTYARAINSLQTLFPREQPLAVRDEALFTEAQEMLNKHIKDVGPDSSYGLFLLRELVGIHFNRGEYDKSETILQSILPKIHDLETNIELRNRLAQIYFRTNQIEHMKMTYQAIINEYPGTVWATEAQAGLDSYTR